MSKPMPSTELDFAGSDVQRWTARRKAAVVIELIKGKSTAAEIAQQHALTLGEVERWREHFIPQGTKVCAAIR